jgi:methyltransferase family protein
MARPRWPSRMTPRRRGNAPRLESLLGDPRAKPDRVWLQRLLPDSKGQIEQVLGELEGFRELEAAIRAEYAATGRDFYAQIRAPFELYALARLTAPDHIVETGVSSGVSSLHFLLALARNGRGALHSIDLPTHQRGTKFGARDSPVALPPGKDTGWVVPSDLRHNWDLRIGPSQELLPKLASELPSIGLFLHDSLHTPAHLRFELETIRPRLVPGAIVLADNTEWTGQSFDRFAASLGVPFFRRRREDLVGLRVPPSGVSGPTGG